MKTVLLHDQLLPAHRNPRSENYTAAWSRNGVCRSRPTCARVGYACPGRRNLRPPGIRDGQHRLDRRWARAACRLQRRERRHLDLGADTANSSWIYDRIGANLPACWWITLALGLWRALSPDVLGRIGAGAMLVAGAGAVLDGFFHLDCRGIDRRLYERLVAFPRAQDRVGHHGRRDHRRAADPRVRVPAHPRMAGRVAAEPAHGARDRPGQCRLLGGWERGGHTSGNGGCLRVDRLRQHASASERRPRPRQPERPAGRRRVARGYECRPGQVPTDPAFPTGQWRKARTVVFGRGRGAHPAQRGVCARGIRKSPRRSATSWRAAERLATIPGVELFELLSEVSPKNGYRFAISMEFANRAALRTLRHPTPRPRPLRAGTLAFRGQRVPPTRLHRP